MVQTHLVTRFVRQRDQAWAVAPPGLAPVPALTIVYDDRCRLCQHAHRWMRRQRARLPLQFVACSSTVAARLYAGLPWLGDQLMVVAEDGRVWAGPPAFVMCLWSLSHYRWLAEQLAAPGSWPLAVRLFSGLSAERERLSALLGAHPRCADDCCEHHPAASRGPYR